jgi:hypothetical protein
VVVGGGHGTHLDSGMASVFVVADAKPVLRERGSRGGGEGLGPFSSGEVGKVVTGETTW